MPVPAVPTSRTPATLHGIAASASTAVTLVVDYRSTLPNLGWYESLTKPSFSPPSWSFAPISTIISLLVAYALFRILRQPDYVPDRWCAVRACLLQIALSAGWAGAFFSAHSPPFGLALAAALLAAAAATAWRFSALDRAAAALLLPGLLWIAFLTLFTLSTAILNG